MQRYDDVTAAGEEWEINLQLYENAEDCKVGYTTKIFALRQIVPDELEK